MAIEIRSVAFHEDGSVVFEYRKGDDERANGMMRAQFLMVPPISALVADRLVEVYDEAERALEFCLREFESSSPPDDADEDAPGYDNPDERDEVRDGPLTRRLRGPGDA